MDKIGDLLLYLTLVQDICYVKYNHLDEILTMRVTLNPKYLPSMEEDGMLESGFDPYNQTIKDRIVVWNIDTNCWKTLMLREILSL